MKLCIWKFLSSMGTGYLFVDSQWNLECHRNSGYFLWICFLGMILCIQHSFVLWVLFFLCCWHKIWVWIGSLLNATEILWTTISQVKFHQVSITSYHPPAPYSSCKSSSFLPICIYLAIYLAILYYFCCSELLVWQRQTVYCSRVSWHIGISNSTMRNFWLFLC